ncbi:MAG: hypothetical protein WCK09_13490 [Bacteroidota bacterium]
MEETQESKPSGNIKDNRQDCGCEDGCCPPKKSNMMSKIIFAVILIAALGVVGVKLFHHPAVPAVKESCCPPGSASGCDTSKTATCDTTKGSSCCPKK